VVESGCSSYFFGLQLARNKTTYSWESTPGPIEKLASVTSQRENAHKVLVPRTYLLFNFGPNFQMENPEYRFMAPLAN